MIPQLALSILVLFPLFLSARPTIPEAAEDKVLLKGLSAAEFFGKRKADASCQRDLAEARRAYLQLKRTLLKEKPTGDALIEKLDDLKTLRGTLLEKIEACGVCATRPIEDDLSWFISDGSCYIGDTFPEQMGDRYQKLVASLLTPSSYAYQSQTMTGFYNLLGFQPVDHAKQKNVDVEKITASPFHNFIALRPVVSILPSFIYYIRNDIDGIPADSPELVIRFNTAKLPLGYKLPKEIQETKMDGQVQMYSTWRINDLIGMWYLTRSGYIRYHTAADFGPLASELELVKSIAREMLLETLVQLTERVLPEVE